MDKRIMKKTAVIVVGTVVLLFILWSGVILGRNENYTDITSELAFPEENRITGGETAWTREGRTLRSGKYAINLRLKGKGLLSVQLSSKNSATIVPGEFELRIDENPGETEIHRIEFDVFTEVDSLLVALHGTENTEVTVESVSISVHSANDRRFTVSFLILGAASVLLLMSLGKLSREQIAAGLLLVLIACFASVPCFKDDLSVGDDMYYHWERLTGLISALKSGQFPARLYPTMNNGYGGVAPVYYPDLFLYPLALMVMAGTSMQYAFHIYIIFTNLLTAFSMYFLAKKLLREQESALIASMLYVLSVYRLTDLYSRSALGEAMAMAFLPLVLLALLEVIYADKNRWPFLSVTAALLFRAHMITTLFTFVLCAGICLFSLKDIVRRKRVTFLAAAVAGALLLCLPVLVPLWTFTQSGVTARMMMRTTSLKAIEPAQLLFSSMDMNGEWPNEHLLNRAIELGIPLLAGVAFYIYDGIKNPDRSLIGSILKKFFAFGTIASVMSTTWFPWDRVDVWTQYISKYIQFPWRLVLITVCLLAIPAAKAFANLGSRATVAVLALCLCTALPLERQQTLHLETIPYGRTPEWLHLYGDYNFEGTIASLSAERDIRMEGEGEIRKVRRVGDEMTVHLKTGNKMVISLPLYAFDGYEVTFEGKQIESYRGAENRLTAELPSDTEGQLRIKYVGRKIWRLGEAAGLLTLILLVAVLWNSRKKKVTKAELNETAGSLPEF